MILVDEIFGPTIQGEGATIGVPTVFVRTGGCDYRCVWCDTLHAVLPKYKSNWKKMTPREIIDQVNDLAEGPILITLSGGNPALQPLEELIALGHSYGHTFTMETQASKAKPWFRMLDAITLSPKPPSSGHDPDWNGLQNCLDAIAYTAVKPSIKVVVFDDDDYQFAREVHKRHPDIPFYLSVGNHDPKGEADTSALLSRMEWLIEKAISDQWYEATILPQLHVLIWGNKRGV